jgi:hypothetical protein
MGGVELSVLSVLLLGTKDVVESIDYSVTIAVEDYVPILMTGIGGWCLAAWVGRRRPDLGRLAQVGTGLLTAGGASKATWKLLQALEGPDVKWLSGALFPLLASGFIFLAWALIIHDYLDTDAQEPRVARPPYRLPMAMAASILILAFALSAATGWSRAYVIPTLAAATLGSLSLVIVGVKACRRRSMSLPAIAFVLNFVGVLALSRLARLPRQTIALQWTEQSINTTATALFAWASFKLLRSSRNAVPEPDSQTILPARKAELSC